MNVSDTRSGMIFAPGATPEPPSPLSCWAPTTPAVPLPWPNAVSSVASLSAS